VAKYRDFDAFFQEQQEEPLRFKVMGEEHQLPPSLPAIVVLKVMRAQEKFGDAPLPQHVLIDLAVSIFGDGKVDEWARKGLSLRQLEQMMNWAMNLYNGGNDDPNPTNPQATPSTS
jgi:hypothetical protein